MTCGWRLLSVALGTIVLSLTTSSPHAATCAPSSGFQATPLTDFAPGQLYLNQFPGFLYSGSNNVPVDHDADGRTAAGRIQPLDSNGLPDPTGKIAFLSIGMSNTTIEYCGGSSFDSNGDPLATACPTPPNPPNQPESFIGQAAADPGVNHVTVVIVDGAKGGQSLDKWDPLTPGCGANCFANYNRVRDEVLAPAGLTEQQVQSIWLKGADEGPTVCLPSSDADAHIAERHMGNILRAIKQRYSNAQQVFVA